MQLRGGYEPTMFLITLGRGAFSLHNVGISICHHLSLPGSNVCVRYCHLIQVILACLGPFIGLLPKTFIHVRYCHLI